jgi:hypothetical protein
MTYGSQTSPTTHLLLKKLHQAFDIFFHFYILGVGVVLGVYFFVSSLCCYGQSFCFKNWGSIPPTTYLNL